MSISTFYGDETVPLRPATSVPPEGSGAANDFFRSAPNVDEVPDRRPFADLGRDIGDVNRHYAPGEHPAERRAAAQHAEESAIMRKNLRPAMRTNNRLRNYMHFMTPLIQNQHNLSDDDSDAVDERYDELRSAALANTLGGARANAMDHGVHDPQVNRDDVSIYRSLRQGPMGAPDAAERPAPEVQGHKSLNLWQEGDPEPLSGAASESIVGGESEGGLPQLPDMMQPPAPQARDLPKPLFSREALRPHVPNSSIPRSNRIRGQYWKTFGERQRAIGGVGGFFGALFGRGMARANRAARILAR